MILLAPVALSQGASKQLAPHLYAAKLLLERLVSKLEDEQSTRAAPAVGREIRHSLNEEIQS
jgi:hypothetical protein